MNLGHRRAGRKGGNYKVVAAPIVNGSVSVHRQKTLDFYTSKKEAIRYASKCRRGIDLTASVALGTHSFIISVKSRTATIYAQKSISERFMRSRYQDTAKSIDMQEYIATVRGVEV